jgi:hypothetical protein
MRAHRLGDNSAKRSPSPTASSVHARHTLRQRCRFRTNMSARSVHLLRSKAPNSLIGRSSWIGSKTVGAKICTLDAGCFARLRAWERPRLVAKSCDTAIWAAMRAAITGATTALSAKCCTWRVAIS